MSSSPWQVKAMPISFYMSIFATLYFFLWDGDFRLSYVYFATLAVVIVSIASRGFSKEVDQEAEEIFDEWRKKKEEK